MNLLVLFFCMAFNTIIDTNCCNANIIIIPKHQLIPIFKESNYRDTLDYVINDTVNENYFNGVIYQIKDKFAYIKGSYTFSEKIIEGWIELKYIGIYLIMESKIPLYVSPNILTNKVFIQDPEWYPLEIFNCSQGWLYVKYRDKKQNKTGWLPPEFQCFNPYTTCN